MPKLIWNQNRHSIETGNRSSAKSSKETLSDAGLDADVSRKIRKLKINPQGKVPFNQSSILNLPTSAQFRDVLTQTLSSQKLLLGYQTDGSMLDILQTSILPISL